MLYYAIYKNRKDVNAIFHGHSKEVLASATKLNIPETLKEIDGIIEKVTALYNNERYLNSNDIMNIVNILKDSTLSVEEQVTIVQELSLLSLTTLISNEKEEQEEDILVIKDTPNGVLTM